MPAKELDAEQVADAARLKTRFKAWQAIEKAAGRPSAQDAIAERLGFGQSALSQYLNAIIPLNAPALRKFCELLGVAPHIISPSIVAQERERLSWLNEPGALPPNVKRITPTRNSGDRGGFQMTAEQKRRAAAAKKRRVKPAKPKKKG